MTKLVSYFAQRIQQLLSPKEETTSVYNVVNDKWVVPEKIHTPPTDGILEIRAGGGVEDSGNPGGRGG